MARRKTTEAYIVVPKEGLFLTEALDDIQVFREIGEWDNRSKTYIGMLPLWFSASGVGSEIDALLHYLRYQSPIYSLSSLIHLGKRIGITTLIIAVRNNDSIRKYVERKREQEEESLDAERLIRIKESVVFKLTRYFRVVVVDRDELKKMLGEGIKRVFEAFTTEDGDIDFEALFSALSDPDRRQEILKLMLSGEWQFETAEIYPYIGLKLASEVVGKVSPYARFYKELMRDLVIIILTAFIGIGAVPLVIAPLVEKYMPKPQPVQLREIKTPALDKIKGMYLPPRR